MTTPTPETVRTPEEIASEVMYLARAEGRPAEQWQKIVGMIREAQREALRKCYEIHWGRSGNVDHWCVYPCRSSWPLITQDGEERFPSESAARTFIEQEIDRVLQEKK